MRLFVGLGLPESITSHLLLLQGGIPNARWEPAQKLHLTLQFLGELDGGQAEEVIEALERVRADAFTMTLAGVGHFPPRGKPRSVWVGIEDPAPVAALHRKIERALATVDVEPDRRKFAPHVTLARLAGSPEHRVAGYLTHHALFRSAAFSVTEFTLYSSVLGPRGSKYRVEAAFGLDAPMS
jgi:2'-5' RNA ligase